MGRIMGIILVGRLDGRRHIRWSSAVVVSCALGVFSAAVAAATYYSLSGQLSLPAALVGFVGPFITVGAGIRQGLHLPIEQHAALDHIAT